MAELAYGSRDRPICDVSRQTYLESPEPRVAARPQTDDLPLLPLADDIGQEPSDKRINRPCPCMRAEVDQWRTEVRLLA
jgi:hypothetical protein